MLRIRQLREQKEITQTELIFGLDKLGLRISRPTLISWENGDTTPRAEDLTKIAKFFEVNINRLFEPEVKK